jgi:hypothetical protein
MIQTDRTQDSQHAGAHDHTHRALTFQLESGKQSLK